MIWLCIISMLSITPVYSGENIDTSHIKVFPAANQSIGGVFQVSGLNDLNQPRYAFNASEARRLCLALGVNIASKAQVQAALRGGFETCRFGWIDEHFAVIPRIKALSNCGQNQTGLVSWRAPVTHKFDVFCFNESDAATQLKDATTDNPLNRTDHSGQSQSVSEADGSAQSSHSEPSSTPSPLPPSSSAPENIDNEAEAARYVGSDQSPPGAKAVVIASTCTLLLVAIIILAYIKMRRRRSQSADMKQQQETRRAAQEDERIEVGEDEVKHHPDEP